jgi:hypothetical protein
VTSMPSSDGSPRAGSFTSATTRRGRLRQLRPTEVLRGVEALLLLPVAAFALRRWGLGRVQSALQRASEWPRRRAARRDGADRSEAAQRLAWVVEVAARRGPWPANCLQRSVVLWWFLRRHGLTGDLRIGVRRRPGSPSGSRSLDFHAWVEHEGVVLNDVPDVRARFATFDRAIAPTSARWR